MQRYDLQKLNDLAVKEQYQVKIIHRYAALGNFDDDDDDDDDMDISRSWGSIRETLKSSAIEYLGYYELK